MGSCFKRIAICCLVSSFCATGATAEDVVLPTSSAPAIEDRLTFVFAPYVWAAGIEGRSAQFGLPTVDLDVSFGDILSNLDIAAMAVAEVRYGRLGLFADIVFADIGTDSAPTPGPLFSSASADVQSLFFTPMVTYRLFEQAGSHLDAMAGLRVWHAETRLSFGAGLLPAVSVKDSETWVDPTVGAKGRFTLNENFFVTGWGIIGGFGASSDFMWDVFGGVGYNYNDWVSFAAGYRGTGVDYSSNGFVYDITQHGPIVGGIVRF